MYSPKIDKHTPDIYRLAQAPGKPMTKVADDLISFALNRLDLIYTELDQQKILFSFLGALISGTLCVGIIWLLGALFDPLYQSEDESTRNFKIFLFAFLISVIAGAVLGCMLAKNCDK